MRCQGGLGQKATFQRRPGGAERRGPAGSRGKSLPGGELVLGPPCGRPVWRTTRTAAWLERPGLRQKHDVSSYHTEGLQAFVPGETQSQWAVSGTDRLPRAAVLRIKWG